MIRLKMNYNNWFFNQYKYLKGKDGAYNDTKWVNAVERYKALEGLETTLFEEQPFGLMSNNDGIDKLLELLGRSNYTFEARRRKAPCPYKRSALPHTILQTSCRSGARSENRGSIHGR